MVRYFFFFYGQYLFPSGECFEGVSCLLEDAFLYHSDADFVFPKHRPLNKDLVANVLHLLGHVRNQHFILDGFSLHVVESRIIACAKEVERHVIPPSASPMS